VHIIYFYAKPLRARVITESDTGASTITTTLRDELGLSTVNTHKYDLTVLMNPVGPLIYGIFVYIFIYILY
jgi:hypothetical protein